MQCAYSGVHYSDQSNSRQCLVNSFGMLLKYFRRIGRREKFLSQLPSPRVVDHSQGSKNMTSERLHGCYPVTSPCGGEIRHISPRKQNVSLPMQSSLLSADMLLCEQHALSCFEIPESVELHKIFSQTITHVRVLLN